MSKSLTTFLTANGRHSMIDDSLASRSASESTIIGTKDGSTRSTPLGIPFGAKGFAKYFKKSDEKFKQPSAPVPFRCSPSPTMNRDFGKRRKTILNTFCLNSKEQYDDKDCYKLYQHTITQKAEKMYKAAVEAHNENRYEEALGYIHKALIMDPDDPDLYILRGDIYLLICDYKSAIMNYKRVCILDPEDDECFSKLAFIFFLQGQCYYDEHLYLDALECFTRAAEMQPEHPGYHSRSIACLISLKRHKECFKMINERLEVESTNPDLLILRARLHEIFSNPTLSFFDIKEALSINPDSVEAGLMHLDLERGAEMCKDTAIKLDMAGKTKEAIMKITRAININPPVTEYHLLRAGMHRRNFDFNAAVDDLLLTMDKCAYDQYNVLYTKAQKQLLLTFNDFAVDCFRRGFYEEAVVLLEKAIQGEKDEALLYVNRGDCFYKLDHLHFALLDYQQAQEMDHNNRSISLRLSVVYNNLGLLEYAERKYYRAEDYFSLAIAHNCTNAMFYLSRARSRYMQEKTTEAQVDILSGLHLDKENKEILSIFARLFPARTLDEVTGSDLALLVYEALQEVIEEAQSTHNKVTLIKKTPIGNIEPSLSVKEKIKQCMMDQEFHVQIIKGKKKVNELVENVIQARQNLEYNGPKLVKTKKPKIRSDSVKS